MKVDGSNTASGVAVRSTQEEPASNSRVDECIDSYLDIPEVRTSRTDLDLRNDRSEQLAFQVKIVTADGNIYYAPVPLDYQFHPHSGDVLSSRQ